jgi:DMSO/TMAO reductase YedYZ molybdopterin-dependent catalytic subunit
MHWSRRQFLIALGTLAAGCQPTYRSGAPTVYAPGSTLAPTRTAPAVARTVKQSTQALPKTIPITDINRLYEKTFRLVPKIDQWSLRIDGLVKTTLSLNMDDIHALPAVESTRTLECIGNPVGGGLVGTVVWQGTMLSDLLARTGIDPTATHATFEAADGYVTTVELKWITQPGVLLVYGANGNPLPPEHGYPLRLLMPGLYGQKMPKWITRIQFVDHDVLGYWEKDAYGWSNIAAVKTNSRFYSPDRQAKLPGPIQVEGMAYAGNRKITKVEVSTNAQEHLPTWELAQLVEPPDPLAWTWWSYDWQPPGSGDYLLAVRASDERGFTQSDSGRGVIGGAFPDGTSAIHSIAVTVENLGG